MRTLHMLRRATQRHLSVQQCFLRKHCRLLVKGCIAEELAKIVLLQTMEHILLRRCFTSLTEGVADRVAEAQGKQVRGRRKTHVA